MTDPQTTSNSIIGKVLIPAVRAMAAQDPRCPYNAEACLTLPMDEDYALQSDFGRGTKAIIVAFLNSAYDLPGETREWTLREWAIAVEKTQ